MMTGYSQSLQTASFQITSVQVQGAQAMVKATHQAFDENLNPVTTYQTYNFLKSGHVYRLTDFMAASSPS